MHFVGILRRVVYFPSERGGCDLLSIAGAGQLHLNLVALSTA